MATNPATSTPIKGVAVPTKQLEPTDLLFGDQIGTEVVTITAGTATATTFKVHKKILCQKIPYFDKMFNGGWRETGTQSANRPDDNPMAFKLLLGWVYVGKIEVPTETQGLVDLYIELYAMAEKLKALLK